HRLADGLQGGVEHLAGFGMLAAGGGKAVDHQVHLAQVLVDEVDGLVLDLVGKGVAIDAFGVEASLLGAFMEGGGVGPAGGAGLALGPFLLEESAEGGGPGAKGGGDAGGEAVAGGGAD